MPFMVTNESTYELAPAGLHPAVCVDVVDEGFKATQFGEKHKVRIVFQIEEQNSKGYRFTVSAWFNLSMHENATLRKFLESWRGRVFAEAEINRPPGFDLESLIGKPCAITIKHNESSGKTYANVDAISPHSNRLGQPLVSDGYVRKQDREDQTGADAAFVAQKPSRPDVPFGDEGIEDDEIPF
jgi:hypothetical protein